MSDSDIQQELQGEPYDPAHTAVYDDADVVEEEDDDDDYDPSNIQFQDAPSSEQLPTQSTGDGTSAQPAAPAKQRTVGGFIEDDDDDDDEEEDAPAVTVTGQENAAAISAVGQQQQRSVTQTPVNATPDTSINRGATAAQDQGSSGVTVPSISINSAPSTNGAAAAASTGLTPFQSPLPPPAVASSSTVPLPKARLPQDTVGILEDRIAADPRGDTDAWLSLIEEYRQRNKIEVVYETYERFLKIFPQAASLWHESDTTNANIK
jgi:cleavage stimulation factor subunit 3